MVIENYLKHEIKNNEFFEFYLTKFLFLHLNSQQSN